MDRIRIVFLGTSGGMPSRERNVASVALVMDGHVLLFDCGDGTQRQLMKCEDVRSGAVEAIFITHLHGDHLFGLPGLLSSLGMGGRREPISVYGPAGIAGFLTSIPYYRVPYEVNVVEVAPGEVLRGRGFRVSCAPVVHHAPCVAYRIDEDDHPGKFDAVRASELGVPSGPLFGELQRGVSVTLGDGRVVRSEEVVGPPRPGRSIVYCTDTRPCESAVALARGADVLIHESTYDNALQAEAAARDHATAAEAADVARQAGAGRLILTHFSPRYESVELLVAEAAAVFANVDAAADFKVFEIPRA